MRLARPTLLLLILAALLPTAALAEARGSFRKELKVTGTPDVEIVTGSGNITVRAGDGSTVSVNARIHAGNNWFNGDGMAAEEKVRRIEADPPVRQNGNLISIGKIDDPALRKNISIDYEVTVPAGTKLKSETGSGDQKIEGVNGALRATTGSGNVEAHDVGGEARLSTGSGDVRLDNVKGRVYANTGSGNVSATGVEAGLYAETGSGDVTFEQVGSGDVVAKTGSGNVHIRNLKGGLEASTGSGDISVTGEARGNWDLHTGSGGIDLQLPQQASFEVNAHSSSGDVTIDHPVTMQGKIRRNHVEGKVGGGGVLLTLRTGSGDIRVR